MLQKRPNDIKIIAHRGLNNIFPQNTLQALTTALYYVDLAELDILLTKDHQIVVFHDRGLRQITNVKNRPQFNERKSTQRLEDKNVQQNDWWVRDFTLEQLKTLKIYQRSKKRPILNHLNFEIITLEELLIASLQIKSNIKQKSGLLIEIKSEIAEDFTESDKILVRKLCELLKKYGLDTVEGCSKRNLPIIIQSFELPTLRQITTSNPIYQLYQKTEIITQQLLRKQHSKNVKGIGITYENLNSPNLKEICDKFDYQIFYWTLKDDEKDGFSDNYQNYNEVYLELKQKGVKGFITEFPDKCRGALGLDLNR